MKSITRFINESMDPSLNRISKLVSKAVEEMTDFVMNNLDYQFLKNAVDLKKCNDNYISWIINLSNVDYIIDSGVLYKEFSIVDVCKKYKHIQCPDAIGSIVEDNWEYELDSNLVDALNDAFDIGGIIDKNMLNGGRFEAFRDFQIAVEQAVIERIKKELK